MYIERDEFFQDFLLQKMNFDDYVNHIARKYRLATAIAVINSKPDNTNLEEYLTTLKNKLCEQNMDLDFNDSVSSGDFELDSVNPDVVGSHDPAETCAPVIDVTAANTDNNIRVNNTDVINANPIPFPENLSQITFFEETQNNLSNNINIALHQNDSQITYFEESQEIVIGEVSKHGPMCKINEPGKSISEDGNEKYVNFNKANYINTNDLEQTEVYTVPEFIENCTHYSESQVENITPVGNKYIINIDKSNINDKQTTPDILFNNYSQNAQDMNLYFAHTQNMDYVFDENLIGISENDLVCDSIDKSHNYDKANEVSRKENFTNAEGNEHNSIRNNTTDVNNDKDVLNEEEMNRNVRSDAIRAELEEMNEEVVPFKIIEELNKVKMFLKRRNERRADASVTDSGYRSDSQGKSFRSGSQLSVNCVNQSAHCLLDYIQTCPLLSTTRDIVKEISEMLGLLVDGLHEDETYPPFIDVILQTIDLSLRRLSEGDINCGDALSTKDSIFQRILHLNKSINLQKYTINNITKHIECFSNEFNGKETHEVTNISKIENFCYILYILEIILTDYTKNGSLPATQTSQDDGKLKRSSLSDVWRRKWNPSGGETKQGEGGSKGKCVLVYCSEVLNKLTVSSMESYSLISYSALKCYNLLQTL